MFRFLMISTLLVASAADTVAGDPDFVRYAVTQGGLLAICLVLLWVYRREILSQRESEKTKSEILMKLVSENTAVYTRVLDAITASEKAAHRLAKSVEKLEEKISTIR